MTDVRLDRQLFVFRDPYIFQRRAERWRVARAPQCAPGSWAASNGVVETVKQFTT
jgi:hypothetical protein